MSYDEEKTRRSRVVVETPQARRETVHTRTTHHPPDRQGYSIGVVVAVAMTAIAATAIIFLFLSNPSDGSTEANINVRAGADPTPLVQTPAIVQPTMTMPTPFPTPPPATVIPAPVIVAPPVTTDPGVVAPAPAAPTPTAPPVDDATLESRINRAYGEDAELARASISLRVVNGRVVLAGSVPTDVLKQRAERLAYAVRGVRGVENRLTVSAEPKPNPSPAAP
ncbi:MAG TPA: BON domain-containing protein [Pyrinomonadaceae bacterium]|nr:BON domain-containing protein [Pyrinomonadaceae bacterium]